MFRSSHHLHRKRSIHIRPEVASSWRRLQLASLIAYERSGASVERTDLRHPANTIEDMKKLLLGYRDNMRVQIESDIAVTAKTVADLRALPAWPDGLALNIHVDLDPRLSVVKVERAS
jgi:hypothetical protein